jgi:hypothetical protein
MQFCRRKVNEEMAKGYASSPRVPRKESWAHARAGERPAERAGERPAERAGERPAERAGKRPALRTGIGQMRGGSAFFSRARLVLPE